MVFRKDFLHLFYTKTISFFQKVIAKLYRCQRDKLKCWKLAISFLYQKRGMLYQLYICFGERHIKAISFWRIKATERRKIWNSYIIVLYLDISLLQKALSQFYTQFDTSEKRYRTVISLSYIWIYHFCRKLCHSAIPCRILA